MHKLYVLSRPSFDYLEFARFLRDEDVTSTPIGAKDGEYLVEQSARVCYMSYGKGRPTTKACLDNILAQKHFSVLEHANWTLLLTGVSRSFTHELVRHRHLSFSQLSQRYVDESEAQMIVPPAIQNNRLLESNLDESFRVAKEAYAAIVRRLMESGLERKQARQAARAVLPNATETKIVVTGNARAWREFIEKRAHPAADAEMRTVATSIFNLLLQEAPLLFNDLSDR